MPVFTVNAAKFQFCKLETKFLGHIILDEGVKADHERNEAILRYPVPKNRQRLCEFPGICNFHQQLILNYSLYVETLLILLHKGNKWQWTDALQQAFEILRAKFAHSIQLIHPDEQKGWIINSDSSGPDIGSALLKERDDGGFNNVSTASRVMNQTEQRYTTCEELHTIAYSLQCFRIYILLFIHCNALGFTFMDAK